MVEPIYGPSSLVEFDLAPEILPCRKSALFTSRANERPREG